ncbi:Zinc finger CCCH domain-containing protein 36, partial [Nymphaea thermarum]
KVTIKWERRQHWVRGFERRRRRKKGDIARRRSISLPKSVTNRCCPSQASMQSEKNMQKCGKPPEKGPQGSDVLDPEPLEEFDNSHETNSSSHMEDVGPSCFVPRETEADATPKANSVKSHGSFDTVRSSAEVLVATVAHSMRCLDSELTTSGREGSMTSDLDNDGIVAEKNKPAHLSNPKEHVEMRFHEVCRNDESIDGKKHLCEQRDMQSTGDQKPNSFSLDDTHETPQTWSLCAEGNNTKRQAIACAFFTKGWCIKGNSCTFLHQNGGTGGDAGKDTGKINMLSNSQMEGPFQCADTVTSSGPSGLLQEHVSLGHDGKSGKDDKLDDPMFFIHQENLGFRSELEYQHVKSVINEFQQSPFERDNSREGLMPHPVLGAPVHSLFTNEGLKVCSSPFEELPAHRTLNFQHQQFNSIQSGSEDLHFRNLVRGARGVQESAGRCFIGSEVIGRPSPFDLPTLTSKNESSLSNAPNYSKGANGTSQASDFVKDNNFGNTLPEPSSSSNIITGFDDKSFEKETSFHDAKVGKGAYLPRGEQKFLMPIKKISGNGTSADLPTASNTESHEDVAHLVGDEEEVKETKAMKCFRAVLIDFVKELVRPSWQHGNLSKDAHKLVVKKSVGKVLSSMHSHQMPSNSEAIEQFLSLSSPKISKLVQVCT